jgi:hypothetical protein
MAPPRLARRLRVFRVMAACLLANLLPLGASQCSSGWTYVEDDGVEGTDSCIRAFVMGFNFSQAQNYCVSQGGHLVTFRGFSNTSALFLATMALNTTSRVIIGCQQAIDATTRGTQWSWVDGTDAANLNCGTGIGREGCGLWKFNEPKYVCANSGANGAPNCSKSV